MRPASNKGRPFPFGPNDTLTWSMKPKSAKSRTAPQPGSASSTAAVKPRNRHLLFALALVAITLAACANSFDGGFVLDNHGLLVSDARVHEATAENLRLILDHTYWWPSGETGLYRPFTTLSWLFNYVILGNREDPAGYHWINFLLHAGNVLMAFALSLRFLRKAWPAFFIAALWAVHPILTESVTNIAGRADLLAGGAILGALLLYLRSLETLGLRRIAWLAGLSLVTAIGIFSKESAAILPGVIVLYELTFRSRQGRTFAMGLVATLLPIALMFWQRSRVLAGAPPYEIPFTDNPIVGADFVAGRLTALNVIARYFRLIAWPDTLSADYSWSQIPISRGGLMDWALAIAVIAIVPATILLFRRFEKSEATRAALFFFWLGLLSLAPVSNLLYPVAIMAEHYLYLPALGVVACLVAAVFSTAQRTRAAKRAPVFLCLLIAALTARTWVRNADWKDDLSIAAASVAASPASYKTHDLLANALFAADPSHANIARVIEESEKTRAILEPLPDSLKPAHPYLFAASCYLARGDSAKAIAVLHRFVTVEAASPGRVNDLRQAYGYLTLASLYLDTGDPVQASEAALRSRALDPANAKVYLKMAEIALKTHRIDDAFIRLTEGEFVTGDANLRQALIDLYRGAMAPGSCALAPGKDGPEIDTACPVVRAHICAAAAFVVATQPDTKTMFTNRFACPM
jgi:tetratricopeptide (TPR) repeat protein